MSTFHGLEMAKQALFAQQSGLYTTGNNISNANTKGYSRQRVNFENQSPYPTVSRNRPEIPGQMGTGVKVGSIERVRDGYLDKQFRGENSKTGFWETKSKALSRMENLMNETTDNGLSKSMDLFWDSLQDLATNPSNSGARSVVVQRANALADSFNYMSKSLNSIRSDLKSELDTTEKHVNSLLTQINEINKQVKHIESHGYLANDLYDERDRLIDELSGIVNIEVSYDSSGDGALDRADGVATIKLLNGDEKITLVNGQPDETNPEIQSITINYTGEGEEKYVESIKVGEEDVALTETTGSLHALVQAYGYLDGEDVKGEYPDMIADLNAMANKFVEAFNEVHENGFDLNGDPGQPFFEGETAGSIEVSQAIKDNPNLIAASNTDNPSDEDSSDDEGVSIDGLNALKLAAVFDDSIEINGKSTTVKEFFASIIGDLGVKAQEANRMADNTNILLSQVQNQRQSVSSVSLDEEMSNMIKFQHAYNAAARSMTTIDEMLDRVINNMGLVGR